MRMTIIIIVIIFHFSISEVRLDCCAPEDGIEYIFNCRPKHQKDITQERLNQWYKNIFNEAKNRGVVDEVVYNGTRGEEGVVSVFFQSTFGVKSMTYS